MKTKNNSVRVVWWAVVAALITLFAGGGFKAEAFIHPGIGLSSTDLATIKANLTNEPWAAGYATLSSDGHSSLNYTMQGPFTYVNRNNGGNYDHEAAWESDMTAVYDLARMWYFTGNSNYAQKAHDILIAWANTQTNYGGIEAPFDLGDYAYRYAGGAEILRSTWSGWTASDTTTVQNYFNNVFWVDLGFPGPMATGSQGMESMAAAAAIAVFNDDTNKFNQVLSALLTDADCNMRDTYGNGEVGDTGRDTGHWALYLDDMAWIAEVFWKQGVDVYSVYGNRLHACAEYNARFTEGQASLPFVPLGAPFWGIFTQIAGSPGWWGLYGSTRNIIHNAYANRLGIQTPYIDIYGLTWDMDSFMFYRNTDSSTATVPSIASLPATASLTTGLTGADLNGNSPAGSSSYSGGTWTIQGGYNGGDPWYGGNDTVRFAYMQVTGDFIFVAKINSISNVGAGNAKAGIMLRDSLGNAGERVYVAATPNTTCERIMYGWTSGGLPYGNNAAAESFSLSQVPYWVKMERVGNRIQTYASINGGDWSPTGTADYNNLSSSVYVGLFDTSMVGGTLNTATFTNVRITGGDNGQALGTPPAPFAAYASPGNGQVPLHWNESFTATSYNVKRAVQGGSYANIAVGVTGTSYVDVNVSPNTLYYYEVSAVNSTGESPVSLSDSATTTATKLTGAFIGTVGAYGGSGNITGNVFDGNLGTYFDGPDASGDWAGIDLGSGMAATVTQIKYCPRTGYEGRMVGGQFQGANVPDFSSGVVTLFTIASQPASGVMTAQSISITNTFRYLRYIGPANGYCNVAEVEFDGNAPILANGTYKIINLNSGKAVDAVGGATGNGTLIDQWTYQSGSNQKWTFTHLGNNIYSIVGVGSGRALEVPGASTANGTQLDIWNWSGGSNQKWQAIQTAPLTYKLIVQHDGDAMNVSGASTANGAQVIQWPYGSGSANAEWQISAP